MADITLPAGFARTVEECWGDPGRLWPAELPGLAGRVMRDWELRPAGPLPLSMNWVSRVRRADGTTAVLKLGVPENGHLADEGTALECFAGAARSPCSPGTTRVARCCWRRPARAPGYERW